MYSVWFIKRGAFMEELVGAIGSIGAALLIGLKSSFLKDIEGADGGYPKRERPLKYHESDNPVHMPKMRDYDGQP